jgi:hypothetical protein
VDLGCRQLPEPQGRARRYIPARWVDQNSASWNQIAKWFQGLELLQRAS